MRLPNALREWLLWRTFGRVFNRAPDFVLPGYLNRWHLISSRWLCVYAHNLLDSDEGRDMHDHRSWTVSLILSGSYVEQFVGRSVVRRAGSIIFRRPTTLHRLDLDAPVMTIFITGPHLRNWGFSTPEGWVRNQDYTWARKA